MISLKKIIEYLIYLYLFLLPISTVWIVQEVFVSGFKWQEGTMIIYLTELLLWLIFVLFFIILIKTRVAVINQFKQLSFSNLKLINLNKPRVLVVAVVWLLVSWAGLSILWSSNYLLSGYYFLRLLEAVGLVLIVLTLGLNFKKLSWSLMMAGLLQSGLAITQFLNQSVAANKYLGMAAHLPLETTASVIEINGHRWLRSYGSFSHPNILGGFLALSLVVAIYFYLKNKSSRRNFVGLMTIFIITMGLFFSFSRSAWLAIFLALIPLLGVYGLKRYTKKTIQLLMYLSLVMFILMAIYSPIIFTRLSFSERLEIRSLDRRIAAMAEAKEIIYDHLIVGVGLGNYSHYLIIANPGVPGWSYQPVHNIYMLILAELGILGFSLFMILVWRSLIASLNKLNQNPVYFSWLLIILVIGFLDHYFWTSYQGITLFTLVLLIAFFDQKHAGDHWDLVAQEYSELIGEQGDFVRLLVINPYIEKQLQSIGRGKVLDLGCGEGYLSRLLSSDLFKFTSVDASEQLLKVAQLKQTPGEIIHADICGVVNLADHDFEIVVMNMVLMDVANIKLAYQNAYRFLKPGGILIVTILHPVLGSPSGYLFKTWGDKIFRREPFIRIDKYGREFSSEKIIASLSQPTKIYHRPVATYLQRAMDVGFSLINIDEPMMSEQDLNHYGQPQFLAKYPVVLLLVFSKPLPHI